MKKNVSNRAVLGIYVSTSSIEGVLVAATDESVRIVHRMVRQRQRQGETVGSGDLEKVVPGLKSSEDVDFTIEIGDGSNLSDAPDPGLMSDFQGASGASTNGSSSAGHSELLPFSAPLRQMVAECAQQGYPEPEIAFCMTPPEVSFVEIAVSKAAAKASNGSPFSKGSGSGALSRKKLLELLDKEYSQSYDRARVAFYPMTPEKSQARYLAVVPQARDSITVSLENLFNRWQDFSGNPRLVETEATLYATLLREQASTEAANSAIVRVGSEDTLILFFEGKELRHYERLRSLSSYDVPETICSRVMLQQDEQKIGSIETLYILGAHEERLQEAFRSFYPDAAILSLAGLLPLEQSDSGMPGEVLSPSRVPAVVAALRVLNPPAEHGGINLIGTTTRRRRPLITLAWHTYAALVLLLAAAAFLGWRYWSNQVAIEEQRAFFAENPVEMPEVTPEEVRATINELEATYQEHTRALEVLDSLLVGSDRWSRTLEHTSQLTGDIPQIWFRGWQPQDNGIRIEGFAMTRGNVAALNRELGGVIERLEYNETNDVRVYSFTIQAPIARDMPEVALYLREIATGAEQEDVDDNIAPMLESDQPHE